MRILRIIPRKPVNKTGYPKGNRDTSDGQCPRCMNRVVNTTPRSRKITYCERCGQSIKWN